MHERLLPSRELAELAGGPTASKPQKTGLPWTVWKALRGAGLSTPHWLAASIDISPSSEILHRYIYQIYIGKIQNIFPGKPLFRCSYIP